MTKKRRLKRGKSWQDQVKQIVQESARGSFIWTFSEKWRMEGISEGKSISKYKAVQAMMKSGIPKERAMEILHFGEEDRAGYEKFISSAAT